MIQFSDSPFSFEYQRYSDGYEDLVFIGQVDNGKPNGLARCVSVRQGYISEGLWDNGKMKGWGRYIHWAGCSIGWWKDDRLHGNSRKLSLDGKVESEGWFEKGEQIGPFRIDLDT